MGPVSRIGYVSSQIACGGFVQAAHSQAKKESHSWERSTGERVKVMIELGFRNLHRDTADCEWSGTSASDIWPCMCRMPRLYIR